MGTLTTGLLLVAGLWSLAYWGANLMIWTAAIALTLIVLQATGVIAWLALLLWPLFIASFLPLHLPLIRKKYISSKAFDIVRQVLPPMSSVEKEAIEAGDTWLEADLFQGNPQWSKWLSAKRDALSEEEQSYYDNEVSELHALGDEWMMQQETKDLSPEVWEYIKKNKFFGLIIPKEYGGMEFSALANSAIITKIGTHSGTTAVTVMVPNALGPAELLLKYGTDKQKEHYLPRLANGSEVPCFALTSPVAGSDAGSIQDRGVVCNGTYSGKTVLGIRLNWDKRYITLAPVATVLGLAFKLYDPEHLLGDKESLGITVCLVPTNTPGVETGRRHLPANQSFMNGPTRGQDVFVPIDWIIGGRDRAGQGWQMLMECLSEGRGISLPALSAAGTSTCYKTVGAYSRLREQFNTPIGHFEGVQEALAKIGGYTYMVEASRIMTAHALDIGKKPSVVTAVAKYHMTELCRQSVTHAMDILGGKGVIAGPSNFIFNLYQVQPIAITVEGANILTRSLMIFGQGAIRCHPFVQKEMLAAGLYEQEPEKALDSFDDAFFSHIRYFVKNLAKSTFMGLTGAWLVIPPKRDPMSRYFQKLTQMSTALALASDVAMMFLGGKLKLKERLSARLGDVLSHLYLSTSVLKYYYENGAKEIDQSHAQWAIEYALHESEEALLSFYRNFPFKSVGMLLRLLTCPFGFGCSEPSDKLSQDVSLKMMEDTELRARLTCHVFLGENDSGKTQVELAFKKFFEVSPLLAKIDTAIKSKEIDRNMNMQERLKTALDKGIITPEEKKKLIEFEKLRAKVVAVDEFSADYFVGKSQWKTKTVTLKAERFSS